MSDYRRLISYLYAYEGGDKGKNMGYAKIEVRDGQCRIQVCVKKVYVGSDDIGVYLLTPGSEILLGRIFIRNGTGEFRIQVRADNIEGSGLSMDECYGLTMHDVTNAWQSYTTIWEDAVTQAAEIQLADVTSEQVREREARQAQPAQQKQSELREKPEEQVSAQSEPEQPEPEQPEPEQPDMELSGLELSELELPVSEEIERELKQEQERLEQVAPWNEEKEPESEDVTPEDVIPEAEDNTKSDIKAPEPEDLVKLEELDRQERETLSRNHLWSRLQNRHARVLAFDYDNGCEILSIKPQDIGVLPREIWVYGNNSFLLHGYYNYRHLILARLDNPKGEPRYLLGVPGHYFSNEKHMASMFGFPHFVLAKKQPDSDGRFGYWYTDIRL